MDLKQIKPAIKRYVAKVNKKVPVERVILFGSYSKGRAQKNSDIDLIVLSKRFAQMDEDQRLRLLYRSAVGFPYNLHVYGFTADEFEAASPLTTLGEVRKTGIVI